MAQMSSFLMKRTLILSWSEATLKIVIVSDTNIFEELLYDHFFFRTVYLSVWQLNSLWETHLFLWTFEHNNLSPYFLCIVDETHKKTNAETSSKAEYLRVIKFLVSFRRKTITTVNLWSRLLVISNLSVPLII